MAIAYKQILYIAAPFSVSLVLNLINRRQYEQLTLAKFSRIEQKYQDIQSLENKINLISASGQLQEIEVKAEKICDRLDQLEVVQTNLKPEIFDPSSIWSEIRSLKYSSDQLKLLIQNSDSSSKINQEIQAIQLSHEIRLEELSRSLENQIEDLRSGLDLDKINSETDQLIHQIEALKLEVKGKQDSEFLIPILESLLESKGLYSDIQTLGEQVYTLDATQKNILDQLPEYNHKLQEMICEIDILKGNNSNLINVLQKIRPYRYRLVIDRSDSRRELILALDNAVKDVYMVCPWLTRYAIDEEIISKFYRVMENTNCTIRIGFGDFEKLNSRCNTSREYLINNRKYFLENIKPNLRWMYEESVMNKLEKLERDFPSRFKLVLMNTHEKYLVWDDKFAIVGSHNFLTSEAEDDKREIGIKTDDPFIVSDLVKRFKSAEFFELLKPALAVPC